MSIIFGLLGVVLGALMTIKSEWVYQNFGSSDWAEQHLGSGGSHTFYKLCGIAIVIISLLIMTGLMGGIILGIFGSLFGIK
jgi:hypothetical protein